MKKIKVQSTLAIIVFFVAYAGLTSSAQSFDALQELKNCARLDNVDRRLGCLEELGKKALATETPATSDSDIQAWTDSHKNRASETSSEVENKTAVIDNSAATGVQIDGLPDSIGGGKYAENSGFEQPSYRGHVSRCQQAADKRWFFVFKNGQVWKQVDNRKRRYKNCDFDVTISKDAFGYIKKVDNKDGKIRISRRR